MLMQSGLYYPYIHVRSETWLKLAALYWKKLDRIVPHDYPVQDGRTARILRDELDFIHSMRPGQSAVDASRLFVSLLREHGAELREALRVQRLVEDERSIHARPRDGGIRRTGTIGYIFAEKLSHELIEALRSEGLAFQASQATWAHGRPSMLQGGAGWVGMDGRLAAVYMTVLAQLTAEHFDLNPVTDEPIAHLAMNGLSVDGVADTLLGGSSGAMRHDPNSLRQRVVLLAVQSAIPRSLGLVSAEEIVAFRRRHEDLLGAFQSAVSDAVGELRSLPPDVNTQVLSERVVEVTRTCLTRPQADLRRALKLFGLNPLNATLSVSFPVGLAAAAMANESAGSVAGFTTGAAAMVTSWAGLEIVRRRALRGRTPAGNYLLALRSGLTPAGILRSQVRSIRSL